MSEVEVLLSCMFEDSASVIKRSNLESCDVLVVNQCNSQEDDVICLNERHKVLNTHTRGLSVSRNLAISYATGDICILADNDEVFVDGLSDLVSDSYAKIPDADVLIFNVKNLNKLKGNVPRRLRKYDMLRVSSIMISFRRNSIVKNKIFFDTILGAGTGNGGSEEIKFLLDCVKKKLKVYYMPVEFSDLLAGTPSTWFTGYTEEYYYKWGCVTRYILGLPVAVFYSIYTLISKRKLYRSELSWMRVAKCMFRGNINGKRGLQTKVEVSK